MNIICPFCSKDVSPHRPSNPIDNVCRHEQHSFCYISEDNAIYRFTIETEINKIKYRLNSWFYPYWDTTLSYQDQNSNGMKSPMIFKYHTPLLKNAQEVEHHINRLMNLRAFL